MKGNFPSVDSNVNWQGRCGADFLFLERSIITPEQVPGQVLENGKSQRYNKSDGRILKHMTRDDCDESQEVAYGACWDGQYRQQQPKKTGLPPTRSKNGEPLEVDEEQERQPARSKQRALLAS